jgi:hypothetical protein
LGAQQRHLPVVWQLQGLSKLDTACGDQFLSQTTPVLRKTLGLTFAFCGLVCLSAQTSQGLGGGGHFVHIAQAVRVRSVRARLTLPRLNYFWVRSRAGCVLGSLLLWRL